MSLLLASSSKATRLWGATVRSKSTKLRRIQQRFNSEEPKASRKPMFSSSLDTVSGSPLHSAIDPRLVQEEESKRTRGRLAAIIAASLAAGYFVYTSDPYSQRELQKFTPESLEEEEKEVLYQKLRAITAMCVKQKTLEVDIMSSPSYSALRKAVYSDDKYIRLLALRALAALARNSKDVRKRVSTTMDFVRLSTEIFNHPEVIQQLETDGESSSRLVHQYFRAATLPFNKEGADNSIRSSELDALLVFAYEDIVSSATMNPECHPKLLGLDYAAHLAKLVKSPCFHVRTTALRGIAGLTRSVEGRQALARTDVFPTLYDTVYGPQRDVLLASGPHLNFGKFALQQLLLSESALDIMLPRYKDYFLSMTKDAKEDLLMRFDLKDELEYDSAIVYFKQAVLGFSFGTVWGALRSLIHTEWLPGEKKPKLSINSFRRIMVGAANASTGTLPLVGIFALFGLVNEHFLTRLQDSAIAYYGATTLVTASIALATNASLLIFPYAIVPTFVGLNAKHLLAPIDGTLENELMVAHIARKGTPDSEVE